MVRVSLTVALALICATATVTASTPDGGSQSPFAFGAGARELSLGGSALATADAVTAPFWNASRLARAEHLSLGAFHSRLFVSDVTYQYFGLVVPTLDLGGFGLGIFRLGVSGIEERDASNLLLGEFDDNRLGAYLAYGKTVSGYDIGAAISMESHSVGDYSATSSPGLSLSVGRYLRPGLANMPELYFTISGRNLISPTTKLASTNVDQPGSFDLGLSTVIMPNLNWDQSMTLSMAVSKAESVDARLSLGLEYSFQDLLFVRGGVRDNKSSFGAGLRYSVIVFDYAMVNRDMGSLHMFSFTSVFGQSVSARRASRARERETRFIRQMDERIRSQNKNTVAELVEQGESLMASGQVAQASRLFDRALFLARTTGDDTTAIAELARSAEIALSEMTRTEDYNRLLDSARANFDRDLFVQARYFAGLAVKLEDAPGTASVLMTRINSALENAENREEMIESRLLAVDSLLGYGQSDQALEILEGLADIAPDNRSVKMVLRRVHFDRECQLVNASYERMDYQTALTHLDSALSLFPGHDWCLRMRAKVESARSDRDRSSNASAATAEPEEISSEVLRQVERDYQAGQTLFSRGDLTGAVAKWEKVVNISTDYKSVREYLVKAYKFIGVKLYGQDQLAEAIGIWKKAIQIDPANEELIGYIARAENEIRKIRELSYEPGN